MLFLYRPNLKKIFISISILLCSLASALKASSDLSGWDIASVPSPQINAKILALKTQGKYIYLLDEKGSLLRGHQKLAEFDLVYNFNAGLDKNIDDESNQDTKEILNFEMIDQFVEDEMEELKSQGVFFDESEMEDQIRNDIDENDFKTKAESSVLNDEKVEEALSLKKTRIFTFKNQLIAFFNGEFVHFRSEANNLIIRGKRSGVIDIKCRENNCIFAGLSGVSSYNLLNRTEKFLHPVSSNEKDVILAVNEAQFFFSSDSTLYSCDLSGKINKRQAVQNDILEIHSAAPNQLTVFGPNWISWKDPGENAKFVSGNFFNQRIFKVLKKEKKLLFSSDSGLWQVDKERAIKIESLGWPAFFISIDASENNLWLSDDEGQLMLAAKDKSAGAEILKRFWRNFIIKDPPINLVMSWHNKAGGDFYKRSSELKSKISLMPYLPEVNLIASLSQYKSRNENPNLSYEIKSQGDAELPDSADIDNLDPNSILDGTSIELGGSELEILERKPGIYYKEPLYWQLSFNWDFTGLFYNEEKLKLSQKLRPIFKQHRRSRRVLIKNFYRRRALQLKTAMGEKDMKNSIQVEELSSILDAMTGYCFKTYTRGNTEKCDF